MNGVKQRKDGRNIMDRIFTVHFELKDGRESSFKVDAPNLHEAWCIGNEQLDPGEVMRGVTED